MRKVLALTLGLICASIITKAQTLADVNASENVSWYGVDFTETRFMNFGAYVSDETVKRNLPRWSFYPFAESYYKSWKGKYKKDLKVKMDNTDKINKDHNYTDQMTTENFELSLEDLQKIVNKHNIDGDGYGIMYIPETYDFIGTKPGKVWGVTFSEKDGKIIHAEKYTYDTYGDWATVIEHTLKKHASDVRKAK